MWRVVGRICTSGLRGPLAEEISRGLLAGEPVQIHSHGGRVHVVQSGELNIDVAFLGVPSCDEFRLMLTGAYRARPAAVHWATRWWMPAQKRVIC